MAQIEDEIEAAERALYRAMITQDFDALKGLLADDLVYIHSTAVSESKEAYLAGVAAGLYDYGAIETRHARNWMHGDAVIRTGLVNMLVGERGKPKDDTNLLFTLVWRRETGGWRLVLRQATRVRS
jgi:ketosteroid isomerase-like protein